MTHRRIRLPVLLAAAGLAAAAASAEPPAPAFTPDPIEFFEKSVRPVLAGSCFECHGAKKQKGGLRLDSREAALKGGDKGPVILPGDPDNSSLIQAVRYTGEVKMPEKRKLSDKAIGALTEWVRMGAPWPADASAAASGAGPGYAWNRDHWAFKPVTRPPIPHRENARPSSIQNPKSAFRNPIDAFILSRLESKGLAFSPEAPKAVLLRRATFDLTGLPPTPEEIAAFEADASPDAWEKIIDRLLASPHYGERWGRHWLDVARYADNKDYVYADREEQRFPFAWTYRDYVIRAFNEDKPYDRFILEQLAADELLALSPSTPLGTGGSPTVSGRVEGPDATPRDLAALGFITVGPRLINNMHDIIDDRIDATCRGLMALTVSCARCHDHKFDPVPTKDYYSLYGVFAASMNEKQTPMEPEPEWAAGYLAYRRAVQWVEEVQKKTEFKKPERLAAWWNPAAKAVWTAVAEWPIAELPGKRRKFLLYRAKLDALEREEDHYLRTQHAAMTAKLRERTADYLLAVLDAERQPGEETYQVLGPGELNPAVIRRWQAYLKKNRAPHDPVFAPWHAFAALPRKEFEAKAPEVLASLEAPPDPAKPVNAAVAAAILDKRPASMQDVARAYGAALRQADREWERLLKERPDAAALPDPVLEQLRRVLHDPGSPTAVPTGPLADIEMYFVEDVRVKLRHHLREKDRLHLASPEAPPHAMIVEDLTTLPTPRVLLRGNPNTPGDAVPRQFLEILAGPDRKPFTQGSGRLELARAIASKDNPLTARVMVNRIWMHHFGAGIVRTPGDFGAQGERPTHPELLDWLAARFMDDGWSVKKMHRLILLSNTWRQSSRDDEKGLAADPENRLLWRMNRRRLDFEAMRDAMLAAAGTLDRTEGGPPVDMFGKPFTARRSVYGFIDRFSLPRLLRTFDYPNPDASSPQRHQTTVPTQGLYLLNNPFVIEQARRLAAQEDFKKLPSDEARLEVLFRRAYGRAPAPEEAAAALGFVRAVPAPPVVEAPKAPPWQYGWGEVDEASKRVATFRKLPHFTGSAWQGGPTLPAPKTGWVMLNAEGGHPGKNAKYAAVRRWVSPVEGEIECSGVLGHAAKEGDGVRGRVISSRHGELGSWTAHGSQAETTLQRFAVQPGDTLDFVVDCRGSVNHDSFTWAPVIATAPAAAGGVKTWNAKEDFKSPPEAPAPRLDGWEQLIQAALLTNEFVFVD